MYYISKSLYIYTYGQSGCKRYWSVIAGASGDSHWDNLDMHLEAVIMWTGRCTWWPWSSKFEDVFAGRNRDEFRDGLGDCVTGGIGRRWYGCCRTELEVRIERQESRDLSKSYYCLLYKRTSKERRKGNPPTLSTLSLYTNRLPPSNHSSCSDVPSESYPMILHTTPLFLIVTTTPPLLTSQHLSSLLYLY